MNTISITGRLAADVELKTTPNGVSVCSFTVAVKRPKVKDKTDWINCVAWRNTAEFICKYFGKGDKIEIVGALTSRHYTDSENKKRTVHEVVIDTVDFGGNKKSENASEEQPNEEEPHYEELENGDDLPF